MRENVVISAEHLSVGYEDGVVASDINFEIKDGDYCCILGENGAGKTTLMRTILGLIKPLSGTLYKREKVLGYLPQQSDIQRDFPASVTEIVLSGTINSLSFRPFYGKKQKEEALKWLKILKIEDLAKKSYRKLSGGQQQRVLLARALAASSGLLLLDEPVTGLDPEATVGFYELLKELNDKGTTIIMITHDVGAAEKYSNNRIYIGKEGDEHG
ncbi:MAG: ATP-binding cassette domain-containing protein [Lachnospiraceae bacterium]|nr:ATP-binding cassette domain-containing protein [Lachnospiraceae bacterium]